MARLRRTRSRVLDKAQVRAAAIGSLRSPPEDGTVSLAGLRAAIAETQAALNDYSRRVAEADLAQAVFVAKERALADLTTRLLDAVVVKFGRHSIEYLQAGGRPRPKTRRRRRPSPRG